MWLAQMVARSASRLAKLCTGVVVDSAFARGLGQCGVGALGRGDGWRVWRPRRVWSLSDEHDWGQAVYVPADVVGQHAQEHVGADPVGPAGFRMGARPVRC